MGVVTFDYSQWAQQFPALSPNVNQAQAQMYFDLSSNAYLDNTDCSVVQDVNKRALLLNLLVAHMATINLPTSQGGTGGSVGRAASASRGSTSVSFDLPNAGTTAFSAWLNQTQWGLAFNAAMAPYKTARYIAGSHIRRGTWP